MTAYNLLQSDLFFTQHKSDMKSFISWCRKVEHPLRKEDDWMYLPLKQSYIVCSLMKDYDPNTVIARETRHARSMK
jgi:hypothetical protein